MIVNSTFINSMRRALRGRKFTPQVSREALMQRTTEELRRNGVDHRSQAQMMMGIAEAVIESREPIFVAIHPHVKVRKEEAWRRAWTVVQTFLSALNMELTRKTIEKELGKQKVVTNADFLRGTNYVKYMNGLLTVSCALGELDFGLKVGVFAGKRERPKLKLTRSAPIKKPPPKNVQVKKSVVVEEKSLSKGSFESDRPLKSILKQKTPPKPVAEQPFKKPTIRDLMKAPAMTKNLSSDFMDESEMKKEASLGDDFESNFESESLASPKQSPIRSPRAKQKAIDSDDFVDVAGEIPTEERSVVAEDFVDSEFASDARSKSAASITVESSIKDSDFDESAFEPESQTKVSEVVEPDTNVSDDVIDVVDPDSQTNISESVVDVVEPDSTINSDGGDVVVDEPVDESSRMMIQMPESSVMEPGNDVDSNIDVFVDGDSDEDIVVESDFDSD